MVPLEDSAGNQFQSIDVPVKLRISYPISAAMMS